MPLKPIRSLALLLLASHVAAHASTAACRATAPSPLGTSIAAIALREYAEFDGHRIDAEGRLWKFGATESEFSVLLDPGTGRRDASRPGRYAWRRVWEYWRTLAQHVPGADEDRMLMVAPGLLDAPADAGAATTYRLGELLRQTEDLEADIAEPLRQAAVRAAMNDTPWSAAFISFVMDRAGLSAAQFRYSAAHWKYVQRAFAPSLDYAWVACDPESARPAVGDLLCYSRGTAPLKRYAEWRDAVALRGIAAPAHCEVVTLVDADARKMETVGGNVLQSVARRKLKLNSAMLLSRSYDPDRSSSSRIRECARDPSCEAANLNMQYWSVLLKLRPDLRPDPKSDTAKPGHETDDTTEASDRGIARHAR
ncbi:DUF2272 domain-containing protein [Noviherbaspirillum pedocola]|uniref:DUF2272 domain-containing protein n=1 Tax=Noviherbaspirillum pedocola TaxID=2801341 RepID=A0A934STF8_9BURK|nr:DUF2272 domain-containing protein [Noviherbaspirillum pedocola]MBK4735337.1 DUF2272 domain-containing protein [Noviherbaspirillum pedocola]